MAGGRPRPPATTSSKDPEWAHHWLGWPPGSLPYRLQRGWPQAAAAGGLPPPGPDQTDDEPNPSTDPSVVPTPVPAWAWIWVEWKLGRAQFKEHAGDPALRSQTGAPETIPPWGWTFLKRFQ